MDRKDKREVLFRRKKTDGLVSIVLAASQPVELNLFTKAGGRTTLV